jgi:Tfp pilus assembly protein PilX
MNMRNEYNNRIFKNTGSVLIVVVFAIALMTAFVAGMLQLNAEQIQLMRNEVYAAQAMAVTEAGMADAFAQLRSSSSWTSGFNNKSFGGGSYTVSVAGSSIVSTGTSAQGFASRIQADITIGGSSSPYIIRVDKLRINE